MSCVTQTSIIWVTRAYSASLNKIQTLVEPLDRCKKAPSFQKESHFEHGLLAGKNESQSVHPADKSESQHFLPAGRKESQHVLSAAKS